MRLAIFAAATLAVGCTPDTPVDNRYLNVRLPQAEGAVPETKPPDRLILNLSRSGGLMKDGRWISGVVNIGRKPTSTLLRIDERTPWRFSRRLHTYLSQALHARLLFAVRSGPAWSRGPALELEACLPRCACCFGDDFWPGWALLIRASVVRSGAGWWFQLGGRDPLPLDQLRRDVELYRNYTSQQVDFAVAHIHAPDDAPSGAVIALAGTLRACGARFTTFDRGPSGRAPAFAYVEVDFHANKVYWHPRD